MATYGCFHGENDYVTNTKLLTNVLKNIVLTPKVKPSFRLNFVEDILSYWLHAQLVFCFHSSIKFLILGLFKRCKKATFGGLGEPPACSLTTENIWFRQQNGRFEIQSNHRKGLVEQKESSCFRTSHVSKRCNDWSFKPLISPHWMTWWLFVVSTERFQISAHYP